MKQIIIVTGAASGLGAHVAAALTSKLDPEHFRIVGVDKQWGHEIGEQGSFESIMIELGIMVGDPVYALVNCAGINELAWFEDLTDSTWDRTMSSNAASLWRTTQALLAHLHGGVVLNVISNASHMPMRCSLAYNASKAAAHMITLQMARELFDRHNVRVFGISPNKLAGTAMSNSIDEQVCATRGWTAEKAREYQLAGLATHEETDPAVLAEFIAFLLEKPERHKYLHGCILPYGA